MPKTIPKKGVQELNPERLHTAEKDISDRIALYRRIVRGFSKKYNCNLEEFEKKIKSKKVVEHPCWEEAIEWGNALDELEQLKTVKQALKWTANSNRIPSIKRGFRGVLEGRCLFFST